MFILRTKQKEVVGVESETNTMLGESYKLDLSGSEEFNKLAKEKGWDDPKEMKIFAFITSEKTGVITLYWTDDVYIMTSEGKTFSKISTNTK